MNFKESKEINQIKSLIASGNNQGGYSFSELILLLDTNITKVILDTIITIVIMVDLKLQYDFVNYKG